MSLSALVAEDRNLRHTLNFLAIVIFVVLAALTASLPINMPHNQRYADPTTLDRGDTAWVMIATLLGLFLTPALTYYYANAHGVDISSGLQLVALTGSLIAMLWTLFSFSLCYGEDSAGDQLIGQPSTYWMFFNTYGKPASRNNANTIPNSIFAIYELGFALMSSTVVATSVSNRVNIAGFLLFILVWHLVVYCPVAHMTWSSRGFFYRNYINDFSGAIPVHMLGSLTALCTHYFLGQSGVQKPKPVPSSDVTTVFQATFLVWFLWFGFNAGKAHNAGPVAAQSIVNTAAGTFGSVLTCFLYDLVMERTTTPISISQAMIIGLIAMTPASGYVTVGGALCISIITYIVTSVVATFLFAESKQINEPFSIVTVHGISGTVGLICTSILSYQFINPAAYNGLTWGNGLPLGYSVALVLCFYICTTVSVFGVLYICNWVVPLAIFEQKRGEDEYPGFIADSSKPNPANEKDGPPVASKGHELELTQLA